MKKRIVSMLTVIAIITAFLPAISIPAMAAGAWDGTTVDKSWYKESETSFTISTPAELAGLASLVNEGTTFKNKTIRLTEDLDLGGKEWTPIGGETNQKAFQGTFEGYDHIISKLNISSSNFTYIGLFGVVSGSVKNLTVMPVSVTVPAGSTYYGGIIAGYVKGGKLFDCHTVEGTIFGGANSKLGGIAGYSATGGSITLCSDDDTAVTHTTQGTGGYAGGIVGYNNSGCNVTGCYNKGNITGGYLAGGIVGQNGGTVSHCYNTGNVKSLSGIVPAAGICGTTSSGATTEYCHNYGSGSGDYLGIGTTQKTGSSPYGTISNCYYLNGKNHSKDTNSKQLTADQFKSLDNFEGWAATGCWGMDSVNFPYPVLNNTVFLYDYKISLYVYNAQDGNYMLAQTIYKDAGEYLTSNDLGDPTSGYTVWTTDKNDFTDASKYKIIDENGFSVTESTNLYAVNVAPQGEGTEAAPYLIPNAPTLEYVRDKINADNEWANKYYALTADIDLNGSEDNQWTPIGNISLNFRGSFDGRGHTVKGLYINNNTADYQGLFGYSTGQIKNLMVEGKVTGNNDVGGIAGYAGWNSTITACANKAAVRGKDVVGGIAGGASQVRRSYNTGSVTVTGTDSYVGAICGYISPSSYTLDSFYLEGTAEKGYGNLSPDVYGDFGLSEELFNSGYVAYRLNGYLVDSDPPAQDIWGQKIGTDDFPVLLTDDNREDCTVYSASFYRKFDADKWSYDAESLSEDPSMTPPEIVWIDDTFANKGSKFSLTPLLQSEAQKEEFNAADAWVLDMADINNADKYITNADDEALICTGKDITLYAVEDINNAETESDGSAEHPYQIPDAKTLADFRDKINAADEAYISAHYELTDNIDLKNENWTPIGTDDNKFSGTFDGKGYTISGFKIEKSGPLMGDDSMIGFFKIIGENGVVKNLTLEGEMTINSGDAFAVGAIAGLNEGKITGCHSAVNITSTGYFVGGIAGQFSSGYSSLSNAITNCYNTGSITARTDYACAGGIVGHVGSSNLGVGYCYNTGSVSATGAGASADGIIGANYGVTARNYYLEGTTSSYYGTEKTSDQFASGEVTWLMQSVQSAQAWGQNLSESGDAYPILTSEADKKVYKIEFKKKDGEGYTSAAADAYVNSAGIAELPSFKNGSHTFSHWTLDTDTKEEYEAGTAVTSDIVLYATHEWEFTASGATITATCKNTDDACSDTDGGSVTLTAPADLTYNTNAHNATVANTLDDILDVTPSEVTYQYSTTENGSYTDTTDTTKAGYYKASITAGNATAVVEYTIDKATVTAPSNPASKTYMGETLKADISSDEQQLYIVKSNEGGVNAGNYDVVLELEDKDNYKWSDSDSPTKTLKFTITQATNEWTTAPSISGWTYNGTASEAAGAAKFGDVVVKYKGRGDTSYEESAIKPENAGDYTATFTVAETGNYTGLTETKDFTIAKATSSYTEPSDLTATYGQTLANVTLTNGWGWDAPLTSVGSVGTKSFPATYTPSDTNNYNTASANLSVTVGKATPEYTEPTTPQSAVYGDTLGGLTLPAGFVWDKGDNESVGNVGNNSFTATFTPNDTVNYNTVQKTITVNVSALPETIISAGDVTTDFINETIGGFANGTYIITVDGNSTEIAVTDGTIPIDNNYFGEDITIVKKAEDANHANSSPLAISISARPSEPSGIEVTKATDDNAANGKITGVDATMEYKAADDEAWTQIDDDEVTELLPDTYYVRIAPTDGTFASKAVTVTIGVMAKVTVVFIDGDGNTLDTQIVAPYTTVTYDGDTPTKTATAQFTYEFTDWDKEVGEVTEDTTFTAQFEEHLRSYKIKWIVDAAEMETDADYGTMPSYGESNPTKTADEYYTYVFDKWTPDIVSVAGAASYTALFNNIPQSYTVTLNTNGGTVTGEFASYSYGTALALPTAEQITKDNCVFGGWYDNKNLDGEEVTAITADATGNKTYFAKWTTIEPPQPEAYSIKGTVYDAEDIAAQSVTVTLKKGIEAIGSATITDGSFIFDEVSDGIYNIIAETGAKSATATITVSGKSVDNVVITLPQTNISTKVDIIGEDTPAIVVSGLDEVAADEAKEETADVKLTMTVQTEEADNANEQQKAINEVKANSNIEYLDISLIKTIITSEGETTEKLSATDSTVDIVIPYDTTRMNIKVYRYDAAATAKAVTLSTADTEGEYYEISDGYITIHTNSFATYAIGYDAPAATDTPRRSGGGSSRAKATPTPSPSATPEPAETAVPESTATPKPTEEPSDWWYTDVPENEWYYSPIKAATDKGLMTAVKDNEFQPEFDITRAMFVTVLYRIEGEPETSLNYTFEDILKGWYYEKAVAWGSANGIIAGYDEKTFAPDDNITREQMAAMLWRYAKYKGIDVSIGENTNILSFNDAENITEYAIPAIQWACGEDIISGYTDNTLRPQANATRAQAAVVFNKIDNIINQ